MKLLNLLKIFLSLKKLKADVDFLEYKTGLLVVSVVAELAELVDLHHQFLVPLDYLNRLVQVQFCRVQHFNILTHFVDNLFALYALGFDGFDFAQDGLA